MKVVIKEPKLPPTTKEIKEDLKTLQDIVGGFIEIVRTDVQNIILICNEEGKLLDLEENIALTTLSGFIADIVVGNIIAVGVKGEDLISLTKPQIKLITNWLDVRAIC